MDGHEHTQTSTFAHTYALAQAPHMYTHERVDKHTCACFTQEGLKPRNQS